MDTNAGDRPVALVTGAAKGMGLEWCRQLAQQGYDIVLSARDQAGAETAVQGLSANGVTYYPMALDVSNEDSIAALAQHINNEVGRLDVVVNNAGINPKDYADKNRMAKAFYLDHLDAHELFHVFQINSIAPLLVVKHLKSLLIKSAHPRVINISSWLGSVSQLQFGGHYGYVGSKNLLNVLNKSMALELKADGIICVNVNPGWVQTAMGGSKATFTTEQAVAQMIANIVDRVTIEHTGMFLQYDGTPHPW